MKFHLIGFLLICELLAFASVSLAQTNSERGTLRGLAALKVTVDGITPELEADGLSSKLLQTDTELKLRKAGIRILTDSAWEKTRGMPALYVMVLPFKSKRGLYSYYIYVRVRQGVLLQRDTTLSGWVATYQTDGFVGTVSEGYVPEMRKTVSDEVDAFINDYLASNQK